MKAVFDHSEDEAACIKTFWFKPERPMDYVAGQYTELTIRHNNPDDRGMKRWFTFSSAPGSELVSITTKCAGDDASSTYKKALFALKPGAEVALADAMGDFVLPKDTSIPLVFVAGGIGLTPFHSMATWLADHHEHRDITLVYGVRSEDEIVFQPTFDRAGIHTTIVVSEPSDSWGGERGRLNAELIIGLTNPANNALIYMSGPEAMVEALEKDMQTHGIDKRQLVGDFFPGYVGV